MESTDKLRGWLDYKINHYDHEGNAIVLNTGADPNELYDLADEIEREIAEKYMLKDDSKLEETAAQEYNITVQVAAGQTIEYNTELRHRCGAATSMSVAFRLE